MAGQASALVHQRGLILWLVGLIVVFQIASHIKMWHALPELSDLGEECDAAASPSPRCTEAQLFRSWQRAAASAAGVAARSAVGVARGGVALEVAEMSASASAADGPALLRMVLATTTVLPAPPAEAPAASQLTEASTTPVATEAGEAWSPMTAWAAGLVELQRSFEARFSARRAARAGGRGGSIVIASEGLGLTQWGKDLEELQGHLEKRQGALPSQVAKREPTLMDQVNAVHKELCEEPHRRDREECVEFLAGLAASKEAAAAARRLEQRAVLGAASARSSTAAHELQEHTAALDAGVAKLAEERSAWEREFEANVRDTYREFCATRGGAWCTTHAPSSLEEHTAAMQASLARVAEGHRVWEREFDAKVRDTYLELCESRGGAWCTTPAPTQRNITQELQQRTATLQAELSKVSEDRGEWERGFDAKVRDTYRELCESRGGAWCTTPAPPAAGAPSADMNRLREKTDELHAHLAKMAEERGAWERAFDEKVRDTYRELCGSRGGTWCTTPAPTTPSAAGADERELRERTASFHAELAKIAEERSAWERDFQAKVSDTYKEMCETRGGRWCTSPAPDGGASALAADASLSAARASRTTRANLTGELKEQIDLLDAKLAKLAEDHKVWERALLEHYSLATPAAAASNGGATTPVPLWADRPNLRWAGVAAWNATEARQLRGAGGRGSEIVEVNRSEVEAGRWVGALPRVACVTAVPLRHSAKSQVKYVVESFRRQTYEGPKQLVLVYHHEDQAAAEVLKVLADGVYIRALAARGPSEDFPSATAFRFGAWSADADAIAQWDFDEPQHPDRLRLQLRALALTSRPACLLKAPHSDVVDAREDGHADLSQGSIVGAASWMSRHWHPTLREQRDVLESAEARRVAAVELEEALAPPRAQSLGELRASVDRSFEVISLLFEEHGAALAH